MFWVFYLRVNILQSIVIIMFGKFKKTLDINYCAIYKKRYNLSKFDDGSWCDSNAALATVFLEDESDTYQIDLLNTTMGGEL